MVNKTEQLIKKLFDEHFHQLVFTSFRIINDYKQAEDIVQNVFVKLWQNFEQIPDTKNLKPYLFKAVQRSSLNYLRDRKLADKNKELFIKEVGLGEEERESAQLPDDLDVKIYQAIDKLPANWHEAFVLSRFENLKYYEIAIRMNISDKTVEKYISKALNFLRLELKHVLFMLFCLIFFRKV